MKTTTEAQKASGMPATAAHGAEARPLIVGAEATGVDGTRPAWRLRSLLLKQNRRSAVGRSLAINKRWPNAYFANAGLFALHTAWHAARQSR